MMAHTRIVTERAADTGVVRRLCLACTDATDDALLNEFATAYQASLEDGEDTLELDLETVSTSDSRLVAVLVRGLSLARSHARHVRVRSSQEVHAWLDICRVTHMFRHDRTDDHG